MRQNDPEQPNPDAERVARRRVLAWAPGLVEPGRAARVAAARPATEEEPASLAGLDLGLVAPVSVTPPGTWRRAAWFAVAASSIVLVMLVIAAGRLAGPGSPFGRIDAFPGLPTGGLLTPKAPDRTPDAPSNVANGSATRPGPGAESSRPGAVDSMSSRQRRIQSGTSSADGTSASTEPPSSTSTSTGQPGFDPDQLIDTTVAFYDSLQTDIDAAWAMLSPGLGVLSYDEFADRWAQVTAIEVTGVTIDASNRNAVATLVVTAENGNTADQRWRLSFLQEAERLVIEGLEPAHAEQPDPERKPTDGP